MKDYVLTLLVAAAVTYLLTPLVRRLAIRVGAMHEPRERDVHTVPVPRMGGVAMYIGLAAGLLVASRVPQLRASAFGQPGMVDGLLLAGGVLVVIGVIDDRWGLSALTQAAGQVVAGAILVATGTQLSEVPLPGGGTFAFSPNQTAVVTILVVVATINAVNFIDGLDGLAAGIVAIAAVSFLVYYWSMAKVLGVSELAAPALASAILAGVCLGFLPHNFHPARIFMGTAGAMLLGLVLAYAPISSINSLDPAMLSSRVNRYPEIMPLLLPAALLVIPYTDLLLAVVRRTRAGLSPFAADSKHLHHRLISIGHSQRASVLVMYLWAALFSGSVVWFSLEKTEHPGATDHHGQPVLVFVVITVAAVVALVLMSSLPRLRRWDLAKSAPAVAAGDRRRRARAEPARAPLPVGGLPEPLAVGRPAEPLPAPVSPDAARSVVGSVPPAVLNGHHQAGNAAAADGTDPLAGGRGDTHDGDRASAAHSRGDEWPAEPDRDSGPAETAPLPAIDAVRGRHE